MCIIAPAAVVFARRFGNVPGYEAKRVLVAFLVLGFAATAPARITRIVIERRESPAYRGQSFGEAGPYEWLRGRAYGELDPKAPINAIITDLEFAPRNARGLVEYSATFTLTKPVDLSKASGVLLYEVANRGRIALAASSTDAGALADLFKRGHVVLSSGWQGDVVPREGIESIVVPVAQEPGWPQHHWAGSCTVQRHAAQYEYASGDAWPGQ